jgi:O-succinylbenzoate synthase
MRVREITLQEIQMKLVAPFETSVERTEVRRILLVQADVDGVIGWGECVAGESPSYSPETADTAWLMLREFLWPLIKGKDFAGASEVWDFARASPRPQYGEGFIGSCRLGRRS